MRMYRFCQPSFSFPATALAFLVGFAAAAPAAAEHERSAQRQRVGHRTAGEHQLAGADRIGGFYVTDRERRHRRFHRRAARRAECTRRSEGRRYRTYGNPSGYQRELDRLEHREARRRARFHRRQARRRAHRRRHHDPHYSFHFSWPDGHRGFGVHGH